MGRPWLKFDEFNLSEPEITQLLDNQMEKDLFHLTKYSNVEKKYF